MTVDGGLERDNVVQAFYNEHEYLRVVERRSVKVHRFLCDRVHT